MPTSPVVPEGTRVYAVGDVHGRADLLSFLLGRIVADAKAGPDRRVLIFLGDVIDRGPYSREVLDILTRHVPNTFEAVFLKGNHEDMMVRFLGGVGEGRADWFANGGRETLMSYDVEVPPWPGARNSDAYNGARTALAVALPAPHRAYLDALRLSHREGDYLFVHAGIRPGVALEDQDDHDLMWIRKPFLSDETDTGVTVVHGHSVVGEPAVHAHRIGIDTGAYASNVLTCLVLEGAEQRFLSTGRR